MMREVALSRARAAIEEHHLSALIATSHASTQYTGGTAFWTQRNVQDCLDAVVMFPAGEPVLLYERTEAEQARESWITDMRDYIQFVQDPIEVLVEILRERRADAGRIALELDMLNARHFDALRGAVPHAEFVDADLIFQRMRAVKTPDEVRMLGENALASVNAIRAAFAAIRIGETELDVAERMWDVARANGASRFDHCTLATGPNAFRSHHKPTQTRITPSTIIKTDFGIYSNNPFPSDVARTAIIGPALPHQIDTYRRLEEVHRTVIEAMRPGVRGSDIYAVCVRASQENGLAFNSPHCGHSISCNVQNRFEFPALTPRDDNVLEPGNVLMVEPTGHGTDGRYHVEDLVEITANGNRVWSRTPEFDWTNPMIVG